MKEAKAIVLLQIYNQIKLSLLKDDKFVHNIKWELKQFIQKNWELILEKRTMDQLTNILIQVVENKNDMNVLSNLIYDLAN